jgi:hypothetical protein
LIAKEREIYAALVPEYWRTKVLANTEARYELEPHYLINEVVEKDADAPALAQYEANSFMESQRQAASALGITRRNCQRYDYGAKKCRNCAHFRA